jgi:hypothetical protein
MSPIHSGHGSSRGSVKRRLRTATGSANSAEGRGETRPSPVHGTWSTRAVISARAFAATSVAIDSAFSPIARRKARTLLGFGVPEPPSLRRCQCSRFPRSSPRSALSLGVWLVLLSDEALGAYVEHLEALLASLFAGLALRGGGAGVASALSYLTEFFGKASAVRMPALRMPAQRQ